MSLAKRPSKFSVTSAPYVFSFRGRKYRTTTVLTLLLTEVSGLMLLLGDIP